MANKTKLLLLEKKNKPKEISEEFEKRNSIVKGKCCKSCLKAYLISKGVKEKLMGLAGIPIGHLGHYMDEDKLIKI